MPVMIQKGALLQVYPIYNKIKSQKRSS